MNIGRIVGITLLSFVDALVPSTATAVVVLYLFLGRTGDASPFTLAAAAGGIVFVGTLTVGFALTKVGHGPFPVTRATKRIYRWWSRSWF